MNMHNRIDTDGRNVLSARRLLMAVLLIAIAAPGAWGQEKYRLDDASYDWEKQTQYDPDSPEGELQAIRKTLAQGQGKRAEKALDQWIEDYPNHPQLVEAYLLRGDAKVAQDHLYESLFDFEEVIRSYPGSEQYHTALQREFEIAKAYSDGKRRRLWGIRWVTAYGEAEEIFIRTQERAPGSVVGEKASLALGEQYFTRGEMSSASDAYDLFLVNYPDSQFREQTMLRLIYASLAKFKGPRFDPSGLIDAQEWIAVYKSEYPAAAERIGTDALLQRIDESMALKKYYTGEWYEQVGKDVSAVYTYRRLIKDHPSTPAAAQALRRLEARGESIVDIKPGERLENDLEDALEPSEDGGESGRDPLEAVREAIENADDTASDASPATTIPNDRTQSTDDAAASVETEPDTREDFDPQK